MTQSQKPRFHDAKSGSAITVHLHFNAKSNGIQKVLPDGTLQIGLVSSKDDPALDDELLRFLSKLFQVPIERFEIIGGKNSTKRLISIIDVSVEQVQNIIGKVAKIPS